MLYYNRHGDNIMSTPNTKNKYRFTHHQNHYQTTLKKNIIENPDLPIEFICKTLIAKEMNTEPFIFRNK